MVSEKELLEEDFEAAREVIARNPFLAAKGEAFVRALAAMHSRRGDSDFRLKFGLRQPRNRMERNIVELWSGEISDAEFRQRAQDEEHYPLDLELVRSLYDALDDMLGFYSQLLQIVIEVEHEQRDPYSWRTKEPLADRYAQEMNRKVNLSPGQIGRIHEFTEEVRVEKGLRTAVAKDHTAPTAAMLTLTLLGHISTNWKRCREIADRSRKDPAYAYPTTASSLFFRSTYPTLPRPSELQALLAEEFTLLRLAFRSEAGAGSRMASTSSTTCTFSRPLHRSLSMCRSALPPQGMEQESRLARVARVKEAGLRMDLG